jgi:hypothetical protein
MLSKYRNAELAILKHRSIPSLALTDRFHQVTEQATVGDKPSPLRKHRKSDGFRKSSTHKRGHER